MEVKKPRRLVIIGCSGFVGSHLLERLLHGNTEYEIYGFDLASEKIEHLLDHPSLHFERRGIRASEDFRYLEEVVEGADLVINLAAICNPAEYNTNPIAVIRTNFIDCYGLVDLCARTGTWLMHFSTSETYGRTLSSYVDGGLYEDPALYELDEMTTPMIMGPIPNQRWTYACAKQLMERYLYAHHKERGLPFTIVRPLNFFGPRMDYIPGRDGEGVPRVLANFMAALLDGTPMRLVDGGQARRTIVSIHDAVRAIVAMIERPSASQNQIFNIGNRDSEVTIAQLAELMRESYAEISGDDRYRNHPIVSVSSREFYGEGYEDCDRRMPRTDRARELLDWTPRLTLKQTIDDTVRYYYRLYGPAQQITAEAV